MPGSDGQDIVLVLCFNEFTSWCTGEKHLPLYQVVTTMYCTSALFCYRANVQFHLQTSDFQVFEKASAPRSKFVEEYTQPGPCAVPSEHDLKTTVCYFVK